MRSSGRRKLRLHGLIVVICEFPQRERPGIPIIRHDTRAQRQQSRFLAGCAKLQFTPEGWYMREVAALREEAENFGIGIHSLREFAEEFNEQSIAVDDRGVALFDFQHAGWQGRHPATSAPDSASDPPPAQRPV